MDTNTHELFLDGINEVGNMEKIVSKHSKIALVLAFSAFLFSGIYILFCYYHRATFTLFDFTILIIFIGIISASCLYSLNQTRNIGWKHILFLFFTFLVLIPCFIFLLPYVASSGRIQGIIAFIIYEVVQIVLGLIFLIIVKKAPLRTE